MSWELEQARAEHERHRENSARLAQAFAKFSSTGLGVLEFETRVDFGLTFIEEPIIAYGSQIDVDDVANMLDLDPKDPPTLPQSTGYVTEWETDDRGFYVGAWVAAVVGDPTGVLTDQLVVIDHSFTFTAVAIKDVPDDGVKSPAPPVIAS